MPSERMQRQLERLLDEAEKAISDLDWAQARNRAMAALSLDPQNVDAIAYLAAADAALLLALVCFL